MPQRSASAIDLVRSISQCRTHDCFFFENGFWFGFQSSEVAKRSRFPWAATIRNFGFLRSVEESCGLKCDRPRRKNSSLFSICLSKSESCTRIRTVSLFLSFWVISIYTYKLNITIYNWNRRIQALRMLGPRVWTRRVWTRRAVSATHFTWINTPGVLQIRTMPLRWRQMAATQIAC